MTASGQQEGEQTMRNGEAAAGGDPTLDDAFRALDEIDACLLGLLPASTGHGATGAAAQWPTPEQGSCVCVRGARSERKIAACREAASRAVGFERTHERK